MALTREHCGTIKDNIFIYLLFIAGFSLFGNSCSSNNLCDWRQICLPQFLKVAAKTGKAEHGSCNGGITKSVSQLNDKINRAV